MMFWRCGIEWIFGWDMHFLWIYCIYWDHVGCVNGMSDVNDDDYYDYFDCDYEDDNDDGYIF